MIKRTAGRVSGFLPQFRDYPSVFFKIYFKDYGYYFERQGLLAASSMSPMEGIHSPHLIQVIPEYKAFILERRFWKDTETEVKRFFLKSLNYDWHKIGAWLRNFHDSKVDTKVNDYFIEWKFSKIQQHLQTLHNLFSPEERDKMKVVVNEAKNFLKTDHSEWVLSHGDFLIGNIKLSDSNMMDVIDFEDCQMAPREFDLINFLTRLEYLKYFPHKKDAYKEVQNSFIKGYGLQINRSTPLSQFLYLYVKLDVIETYFRRRKLKQTPLYQKAIYQYFEKNGLMRLKDWLKQL